MTTIIKTLFFATVRASFVLRLHRWPASLLVQWRCARRIDAMTRRLLRMRAKIRALSGHLMSGAARHGVDAPGAAPLHEQ